MIENFLNSERSNLLRYLFVLILVGVFFMLIGNLFTPNEQNKILDSDEGGGGEKGEVRLSESERLERELEDVLAQVSGVGTVAVNITLDSGPEYIYARNNNSSQRNIIEEDKSGGTRETDQDEKRSEIVVLNQGGHNKAVVKNKIQPQIRGVLVVAEGAVDSRIKADLIAAVKVGLGIGSHKIKVLAKER